MKIILDPISLVVAAPVEMTLDRLQEELVNDGFECPYEPQGVHANYPIHHYLKKRILNRKHYRYGQIEDLCLSISINDHGHLISTKAVPRAATGPDFKKMFIGSNDQFGKMEKVILKVIPIPEERLKMMITWKDKNKKELFRKAFWKSGVFPALYEEGPMKITVGLEGSEELVLMDRACVIRLAKEYSGKGASS